MNFEELRRRDPDSLSDEERFRLGLSFYDSSRREDQEVAESLGVTAGDAMAIAFDRKAAGHSILEWYDQEQAPAPSEQPLPPSK
jgi:hypothetical protein